VIKQADVALLLYLLRDRFTREMRTANFDYYEPRTAHGSSLSPAIHALMAARLDRCSIAETHFQRAAAIDLADNLGNAAGGVHMAALGGLWQATVFGFAGLSVGPDGLRFDPHLPSGWRNLRFPLQWRGRRLQITLGTEPESIEIEVRAGEPVEVSVGEHQTQVIRPGHRFHAVRNGEDWDSWEEMSK
jgi:kojibiose phosphorylase